MCESRQNVCESRQNVCESRVRFWISTKRSIKSSALDSVGVSRQFTHNKGVGVSRQSLRRPKAGERNKHMSESALKPLRYPQGDLFVCELTDVILKDDMASMEYPFYSISKKPDREPQRFTHGDNWIEIRPSAKGKPTIYDKDIIIYVISQIAAATNRGDPAPRKIEMDPYSFLVFTQRRTGGRDYDAICDMVERLDGTRFRTNVKAGGIQTDTWFGMLDSVELTSHPKTGKLIKLTVTVSEWLANAIQARDLLTLHPDYFRLRRPLERRLYEVARKRAGRQSTGAKIKLPYLKNLCGSTAALREFRRMIGQIIRDHESDELFPDYGLSIDDDIVTIIPKAEFLRRIASPEDKALADKLRLKTHSHEDAREILRGWCPADVESRWRTWVGSEGIPVKNAHAHYIDFCKKYVAKRGPCR